MTQQRRAYKSVYVKEEFVKEFDELFFQLLYDVEEQHLNWGVDVDGDWDIDKEFEVDEDIDISRRQQDRYGSL